LLKQCCFSKILYENKLFTILDLGLAALNKNMAVFGMIFGVTSFRAGEKIYEITLKMKTGR
jgi:hypothetical protein